MSAGPQRSPQRSYSAGPWTTVPIPATLCSLSNIHCTRDPLASNGQIYHDKLPQSVRLRGSFWDSVICATPFTNRTFSFRAPRPARMAIFAVTAAFGPSSCGARAEHREFAQWYTRWAHAFSFFGPSPHSCRALLLRTTPLRRHPMARHNCIFKS